MTTKFLMNTFTGSIDTEENWKADYRADMLTLFEMGERAVSFEEWGENLVEVTQDGEPL